MDTTDNYNVDESIEPLPNAKSFDPLTQFPYTDVYGTPATYGQPFDTQRSLLPEGFRDIQVWADLADSVDEVFGKNIGSLLKDMLGINDPTYINNWPSIDRALLLKLTKNIGLNYRQNDIFTDDDLRRFLRYTPMFWKEKGTVNFIQYMSFVINAAIDQHYLWTEDYKNFYPEGSPSVGTPIWQTETIQAVNYQLADGDNTQSLYPLLDTSNNPLTKNYTINNLYITDWQGRMVLYSTPRTNLYHYSQDFSQDAYWVKPATLTPITGVTGPDGNSTAITYLPNNSTATPIRWRQTATVVANTQYIVSYILRANGQRYCQIYGAPTQFGSFYVNFDLQDGKIVGLSDASANAALQGYGITVLPNNYYRVWVKVTPLVSGGTNVVLGYIDSPTATYAPSLTTDGTKGYDIFGAQFEQSSVMTRFITNGLTLDPVTDYSLTSNQIQLASNLTSGAILSWDGSYRLQGTWYPTSHVFLSFDVNKFRSTVAKGFDTLTSLADFYYMIAPLHLVIKAFVETINSEKSTLYIAGAGQIQVWSNGLRAPSTPSVVNGGIFGPADGTTTTFQLKNVNGNVVTNVKSVRNVLIQDWQGTTNLSKMRRTNLCVNSSSFGSYVGAGAITGSVTAPDGGTAGIFVPDTSAALHTITVPAAQTAGNKYVMRVRAKGAGYTTCSIGFGGLYTSGGEWKVDLSSGATLTSPNSSIVTSISGPDAEGFYLLEAHYTTDNHSPGDLANAPILYAPDATTTAADGTSGVAFWGLEVYAEGQQGKYIPTSGSAVTVTDYLIGLAGMITLGQAPIASTVSMTWNGVLLPA